MTREMSFRILRFDSIDSTNLEAMRQDGLRLIAGDMRRGRLAFEADPAIAADGFGEIGLQVGRQREFAVARQDFDHRGGAHARGGGVP